MLINWFFFRYHRSVDFYKIYYKPSNGNTFKYISISNEGDDSEPNDSNQRVSIRSIDSRDGFEFRINRKSEFIFHVEYGKKIQKVLKS